MHDMDKNCHVAMFVARSQTKHKLNSLACIGCHACMHTMIDLRPCILQEQNVMIFTAKYLRFLDRCLSL
jgi:TPP-dependent indolepyruvate ferredoxin oxidoreductase alpha subunit